MTSALPAFYLIVQRYDGDLYSRETLIERSTDRVWSDLVDDVWSGEIEDVTHVLLVDVRNGKALDVTEDLAQTLSSISHRREQEPSDEVAALIRAHGSDYFTLPDDIRFPEETVSTLRNSRRRW